ncbi:hypothetical protein QFZ65_000929 [Arthrobacter sp. B3I9]|uniref:hypothetical protein n=1 Tax=Arthrobacter sp. B3I9 TaxID=3042270 RepID=UPI002792F503|nr:hypothetical protein [Arthrobacter sp. B3I9]MDQ0848991.1 hypothetical protein [Arthrobacter sp. B3I9]
MNEQDNGQLHAPSDGGSGPARPAGFGDAPRFTADKAKGKPGMRNEAVLGPFTVRDLTVFGSTLILFIASLIPMFAIRYNLWNLGSLFFLGLGILLPLIVCALFVARRLSPGTKMRIGSLSVDQFASVVASFAVAFFFLAVAVAYVPSMLLALVGALGLFAGTVLARFVPYLAGDFLDRAETPAHVAARDAAAPVRKPRTPKAPAEAKEAKDQGRGKETVSGWAKRIRPGGPAATPAPAERDAEPRDAEPRVPASDDAVRGTAAGGSGGATAVAAGSPEPAASQTPPAQAEAAPHAVPSSGHGATATGAPATQLSGVVPAATASSTTAPAAAATTPAAAERATAAAEETRAAEVPPAASTSAPTTVNPQVRAQEPIGATVDPAQRTASNQPRTVQEAFWFAVAQPRTAVDEVTGVPAFVIEPGAWVLALEDRGSEFVVQHTDGRVGVLRDLSNIERG